MTTFTLLYKSHLQQPQTCLKNCCERAELLRLDLPESGTHGEAYAGTCLAIGFLFFIFDLEHLKGVQNSIALHAQIYLIAWEFGRHKTTAMLI